ncbi:MAG: inorganic diphosphatase [Alphaproteobacteria bacterium]|nr:inorganic diphosphatase [Alphaproteobacteria bacterium]
MKNLEHLPTYGAKKRVNVVIETPRGATAKFKFDAKLGGFKYVRSLKGTLAYPFDWGFVPSTAAADGDPLDAMVLHDDASFAGAVIACRAIGILEVEQQEKGRTFRNDRVLFAPSIDTIADNLTADAKKLRGLQKKLERFFKAAVAGTGKKLKFLGWRDAEAADAAVRTAARAAKRKRR